MYHGVLNRFMDEMRRIYPETVDFNLKYDKITKDIRICSLESSHRVINNRIELLKYHIPGAWGFKYFSKYQTKILIENIEEIFEQAILELKTINTPFEIPLINGEFYQTSRDIDILDFRLFAGTIFEVYHLGDSYKNKTRIKVWSGTVNNRDCSVLEDGIYFGTCSINEYNRRNKTKNKPILIEFDPHEEKSFFFVNLINYTIQSNCYLKS